MLAKEKSDMAGQFHEAKIADEMLINELKLKVNIILNKLSNFFKIFSVFYSFR